MVCIKRGGTRDINLGFGKAKRELTGKVAAKVKLEQKTAIARKMLSEGFDLPRMAKLTGLSENGVRQLKQKMEN